MSNDSLLCRLVGLSRDGHARPLRALFVVSGAAAVCVALVSLVVSVPDAGVGRVRDDLEMLRLYRRLFGVFDVSVLEFMPLAVNVLFKLDRFASLVAFVGLAVVVNLVLTWLVALVLAPFVFVASKVFRVNGGSPKADWFWRLAFPLAVLAGFLLPAIYEPMMGMFSTSATVSLAVSLAVVFVLWMVLLFMFRTSRQASRLLASFTGLGVMIAVVIVLGGAAALAIGTGSSSGHQLIAPAGQPNILLISIDSLRADHLSSYGYPRKTSPNIDVVAAQGALFKIVVAPSTWTLPTHLSMLTSLAPEEHGVVKDKMRLSEKAVLLQEVLWRSGYTTAGFVAGPYLDAKYGFSKGFDYYDDFSAIKSREKLSHRGITSPKSYRIFNRWLTRWDRKGRRRPFFVFLHMWDVHFDYAPPAPYDTMFDPDYKGDITSDDFIDNPRIRPNMNPRDLEHIIALYDGEIRFTDMWLGKVFDRLKELGVWDNTIIVITSDHGDEFFEHGMKGHRANLYGTTTLVPLIIRYPPQVPAGKVVERQVRLIDIPPTILTLAGLTPPADFGTPALSGTETASDLTPFVLAASTQDLPGLLAFGDLHLARGKYASIQNERYKLILYNENGGRTSIELYDLRTDLDERHNIAQDRQDLVVQLREQLVNWRANRTSVSKPAETIELGTEHERMLRSLGYIQ